MVSQFEKTTSKFNKEVYFCLYVEILSIPQEKQVYKAIVFYTVIKDIFTQMFPKSLAFYDRISQGTRSLPKCTELVIIKVTTE